MEATQSLSNEEVLSQLVELTQGLYYRSESDYPLEVVQFESKLPNELTKEEILTLTSHSKEEPIRVTELASFFRQVIKSDNRAEEAISTAQPFQDLQTFLEQHLLNLRVYRIGKREIQVYVLGKLSGDFLAGIKTTAIET